MKKNLIIFIIIFIIIFTRFSVAESGVFKVCHDGKIKSIKEVEQLCLINIEKSITLQEVYFRFELDKKHVNYKYFLIILPVPTSVQNIDFKIPISIDYFNISPMVCLKNENSVINILNFFKKYYNFDPPNRDIHTPFFSIQCKDEESKFETKKNVSGTLIKKIKIFETPNKYEIIQPSSIEELKLYFKSKNEELPDETYKILNKYINNYSFFIARTDLPVKKIPISTYESIFQDKETESIYLNNEKFTLSRQKLWVNNYVDIYLAFPSSTIYCPVPICTSEADNISSLTLVINNIAYFNDYRYNYFFDVRHYYSNENVRAKIPFKQSNEFAKTIGYTFVNAKNKLIDAPVNNIEFILPIQKFIQEILFLTSFILIIFFTSKLILKLDYFESFFISVIFIFIILFDSYILVITVMLLICNMVSTNIKYTSYKFNKIDIIMFVVLLVFSLFDIFIDKNWIIQASFIFISLIYGISKLRQSLIYISATFLFTFLLIIFLNKILLLLS